MALFLLATKPQYKSNLFYISNYKHNKNSKECEIKIALEELEEKI